MGVSSEMVSCIYCGVYFDTSKGEGDHVLPVQLGEFRNDQRFRRICPNCNSKIGHSEQQLLACAPEAFFRRLVNPKVPSKRQRGKSPVKGAMGVPSPESTIDHGDHRELVYRSSENPMNAYPVDQIVIHDDKENEYFIKLFSGMKKKHIEEQMTKKGITKVQKIWFHFDDPKGDEFENLIDEAFPDLQKHRLPYREAGIIQIDGRITFKFNDHYFRAVAKMAFHYYLIHSRRGYRGDETIFNPIRNFIMNGGDHKPFFNQEGPKFEMPFGDLPSGGVITPDGWCHVLSAYEEEKCIVAYVQLFVGRGCIPQSYHVKLAEMDNNIVVPKAIWGHVYLYDKTASKDHYAGEVKEADVTRLR
jgi:hypothetical protein